jgi:sulfur-oxidizing protein SoxB
MHLDDGTRIDASKSYRVAGWATVGSQSPGAPIWDVVADYLRGKESISIEKINTPKLKNITGNPGIA